MKNGMLQKIKDSILLTRTSSGTKLSYDKTRRENRVIVFAIRKAVLRGGRYCAQFNDSELQEIYRISGDDIYESLRLKAKELLDRKLCVEEGKRFRFLSIIDRIDYGDGVMQVRFNIDLSPFITRIQREYVELDTPEHQTIRRLEMLTRQEFQGESNKNIHTGIRFLDEALGQLDRHRLIVLAGRPSLGKTALALEIAENVALKENNCVALFSTDLSKNQVIDRLCVRHVPDDEENIEKWLMESEEREKAIRERLEGHKLIVNDTCDLTVKKMDAICIQYKENYGLRLIIIDDMSFFGAGELRDKVGQLKKVSEELDIPVVLTTRLNRSVDLRPDHRPTLADLQEKDVFMERADAILLLYREGYYRDDKVSKERAEIIMQKSPFYDSETIRLRWSPYDLKFYDSK